MTTAELKEISREILTLTKELILFKTTADRPDELIKCIEFIKNYFDNSHFVVRDFNFKHKPSLFISFNKRKKQDLILNGHIDVVPGSDSQFIPKVEGNLLFGRGSGDMKAAVAAMMVLMKHLAKLKKPPKVGLMIVSDEEIGGENGTAKLLKLGFSSKFCFTGESSVGYFPLVTKHKGCVQVKITAYGSSSHSSRPWQGNNAINKLINQYKALIEEFTLATSKHKWHVSVNPTSFVAESAPNVTPSKAEIVLDIRTNEEFTNRKIINILKKHKIKYKKIMDGPMMFNSNKHVYIKSLKRCAERVLKKKVKYIKSCGGSDSKFFTAKNIPSVNLGPVAKNVHKHNEYVEIDSLEKFYHILSLFVQVNFMK